MAIYKPDDEGVMALNDASTKILDARETLIDETKKMREIVAEHSGKIGPHESELIEALESIADKVNSCTKPVESVAKKLKRVADAYQAIIDKKRYSVSGN